MPEPNLRASDADRAAVAAVLGEHMAAGRLTLAEYDERVTRAYAAKTYGDLAELTADLPAPQPHLEAPSAPGDWGPSRPIAARPSAAPGPWARGRHPAIWAPWLTTALVVVTVWLATSLGNGRFEYFWPIWVIGPWGAVLLSRTITGGHHRPRDRRKLGA